MIEFPDFMAEGLVVLATPVGSLPEMLETEGAGWLAAGTSSEELAGGDPR